MHRTPRTIAAAAVSLFLLVGTAACGSSGSEGASDGTPTSAADDGGTTAADDAASEGTVDAGTGDSAEDDCAATADSANLSGDSVVLFAADQDERSEADLTDEDVATISADGSSMEPGEIEVAAGDMFGIEADGGGDIDAVIIGCAGGQTLVPGVAVGFVITEPGTYPVSLDIAGTELGTVVVS